METPPPKSSPLSYVECTEQKPLSETRDAGIPWKKTSRMTREQVAGE